MAKFAVLHHEMPDSDSRGDHFDFLLELKTTLATWEISNWPPVASQSAKRLDNHRKSYLDYEGMISRNRGTVRRVSQGTFEFLLKQNDLWIIRLDGESFSGVVQLKAGEHPNDQNWILSMESAGSDTTCVE